MPAASLATFCTLLRCVEGSEQNEGVANIHVRYLTSREQITARTSAEDVAQGFCLM